MSLGDTHVYLPCYLHDIIWHLSSEGYARDGHPRVDEFLPGQGGVVHHVAEVSIIHLKDRNKFLCGNVRKRNWKHLHLKDKRETPFERTLVKVQRICQWILGVKHCSSHIPEVAGGIPRDLRPSDLLTLSSGNLWACRLLDLCLFSLKGAIISCILCVYPSLKKAE